MSTGKANLRLAYRAEPEEVPSHCSPLDLEFIRYVFSMPDHARAKLFAFLHLTEHHRTLEAEIAVDATGEVHLVFASKTEREAS